MLSACAALGAAGSGRAGGRRRGKEGGGAPGGASSSGPEGGAAASVRAALYPGEEALRRRPVTPGPAGPAGLPPRHSLAPARRPTPATDLPADRHTRPESAKERASDLCLPGPDNNKRPRGPAPAPEWPAPAAGIESSDNRWGRLPPVTPSLHFYWLRSVWSGPWSPFATRSEAPASMSCSLHREGLGPSACTSSTPRRLSAGQR